MSAEVSSLIVLRPPGVNSGLELEYRESIREDAYADVSMSLHPAAAILANFSAIEDSIIS